MLLPTERSAIKAIRDETRVWFVHDEHNSDGAHKDSMTTKHGFVLLQLRRALEDFAICAAKVAKLRAAVRLAAEMQD